jgi:hypothetical protein
MAIRWVGIGDWNSNSTVPFVTSEVETPIVRACLLGISTTLDANGC